MKLTRFPINTIPKDLSDIEIYALVDAYNFVKSSLFFPEAIPEITHLEYLFLIRAYEIYYSDRNEGVYSEQFEKGMKKIDSIGEL